MLATIRSFKQPLFFVLLILGGVLSYSVFADDDDDDKRDKPHQSREKEHSYSNVVNNATWQTECSACHIAYPPKLLPAESWKLMMTRLDQHFGSDASLDAATLATITPFLEQNASRRKVEKVKGEPVLRITETRWFKKEHDEISAATWQRPAIKSASNCMACHTQADKGDFDEDTIVIPR